MKALYVLLTLMGVPQSPAEMEDGVKTWPVALTVLVHQVCISHF